MGLFVLPLGDTPEENVLCAEANLRIYWEDPEDNGFSLGFAISCLKKAQEQITERGHHQSGGSAR